VTLFGETTKDRMKRLKEYELEAHEKHGGSMGTGHEIQAILASEVENEIVQATLAAMESDQRGDTEESRKEKARREKKMNKRHNKYKEMKPREEFKRVEDYITFFFKRVLLLWEEELNERPDDEKKSGKGKVASATQKQTRSYLATLFSELKRGTCPKDVVVNTDKIVNNCIIREYVKANEAYLKMAIGNAAWPMGVTMVGIHERAGREKIFSNKTGHVLNSEKSRKYIQGMKRIMTFCQHAFPNVPSKMVI
jgi:pre-mRNA-splicing factor 18